MLATPERTDFLVKLAIETGQSRNVAESYDGISTENKSPSILHCQPGSGVTRKSMSSVRTDPHHLNFAVERANTLKNTVVVSI